MGNSQLVLILLVAFVSYYMGARWQRLRGPWRPVVWVRYVPESVSGGKYKREHVVVRAANNIYRAIDEGPTSLSEAIMVSGDTYAWTFKYDGRSTKRVHEKRVGEKE